MEGVKIDKNYIDEFEKLLEERIDNNHDMPTDEVGEVEDKFNNEGSCILKSKPDCKTTSLTHYQQIVNAIGVERYASLPVIDYKTLTTLPFGDAYIDKVDPTTLPGSISRGVDQNGRRFVCIRWKRASDNIVRVETLFQRYIEQEVWYAWGSHFTDHSRSRWVSAFGDGPVMNPKYFERLRRIVNNEPCGEFEYVEKYGHKFIENFDKPVMLA
jgi:hypothetical protein